MEKTQIEINQERMLWMESNIKEFYKRMIHYCLYYGLDKQAAIEKCWEEFKPKENC